MATEIEPTQLTAQSLAFDVLEEIFMHSLPGENDLQEHPQPSPSIPPMLFLQVCKSWKIAALNMPYLWSSIYLTIPYFRSRIPPYKILDTARNAVLIQWWKDEHASIVPSLCLKPRDPPTHRRRGALESQPKTAPEHLQKLFSNPFFRSARRLELGLNTADFKIISTVHTTFENLVDLRLEGLLDSGGMLGIECPFPPSPNLRRLHLSNYHYGSFRHQILGRPLFPWGQLTHLYFPRAITQDYWVDLMKSCLNLQFGAFGISFRDYKKTVTTVPQPSIMNLQQMVVAARQLEPSPFKELIFPRLTALRLISSDLNRFTSLTAVDTLLQATPALTELHFDFCINFSKSEGRSFISSIHEENFELEDRQLSIVVPHLQLLVIDFIDPGDANVGSNIIQFLQSTWLCSGWMTLDAGQTRRLKIGISPESSFTSRIYCNDILHEVTDYLKIFQDHPVFSISVRKGEFARNRFHVFNEGKPRRGWEEALQFEGVESRT